MRNRFPGTCYRCGMPVAVGKGHFERLVRAQYGNPKWRVQHAECAIRYRGSDVGNRKAARRQEGR